MMEMVPLLLPLSHALCPGNSLNNNGSGVAARERQALESFGSPGAW